MSEHEEHEKVQVRVTFPITRKGPYTAEVGRDTTVGTVLATAMAHFEVENDDKFTYVLNHDGERQEDSVTVGALAGKSDEVHFTLVKIITQG